MGHGHSHAHHDHGHGPTVDDGLGRLRIALALTASFMGVEALAGWWTGSLALLADAGHMLSDTGALLVALAAATLARRPPDARRTMGWRRAEVLGATINASLLLAIAALVFTEGVDRFSAPHEIVAGPMLAVAALGLLLNLGVAALLLRGETDSINVRAALWHVAGDALGSVGALVAAACILAWGWIQADAVASMFIAVIIGIGAIRVLRETAEVLMQSTPQGFDLDALRRSLITHDAVTDIHDLHLWSIAPGSNVLTVHVVLRDDADPVTVPRQLEALLRDGWALEHVTIQVEVGDAQCGRTAAVR